MFKLLEWRFINTTYSMDCDLNLTSGKYVVNGKSIMGIFSLDLSKPIEVNIVGDNGNTKYYPKELEAFII